MTLTAQARLSRLLVDLTGAVGQNRRPDRSDIDAVRNAARGSARFAELAGRVDAGATSWAAIVAAPREEGQAGLDLVGEVMRRAAKEIAAPPSPTPLQ
ncbi:MAG: hypothetical protein ACRCYU_05940 [Nocardioides sp.]